MKKTVFAIITAALMLFSLCACNVKKGADKNKEANVVNNIDAMSDAATTSLDPDLNSRKEYLEEMYQKAAALDQEVNQLNQKYRRLFMKLDDLLNDPGADQAEISSLKEQLDELERNIEKKHQSQFLLKKHISDMELQISKLEAMIKDPELMSEEEE